MNSATNTISVRQMTMSQTHASGPPHWGTSLRRAALAPSASGTSATIANSSPVTS
jgi:hypothetical protein